MKALKTFAMRDEIQPAVYILASRRNGTLYIGVTSELCSRIAQHRDGSIPGFTKKYNIKSLVWFQYLDLMPAAIAREKTVEGMEACLETQPDRKFKSGLARSIP